MSESGNARNRLRIGIIGGGVIGCGWAARFRRIGADIVIFDSDKKTLESVPNNVAQMMASIGQSGECVSEAGQGSLRTVATLDDQFSDCVYVQECVTENPVVKAQVFQRLDDIVQPNAVLASSTSALLPEKFLGEVGRKERCLIAHPFNPPHAMPLVEVVKTPWVAPWAVNKTCELLENIGMEPVVLAKAVPGFVANRLQVAVVNEAIALVRDGVISPEALDRCMTGSLGLRWAFLGPFRTMDLNSRRGFRDYASKYGDSYVALGKELVTGRTWSSSTLDAIERYLREDLPLERIEAASAARDATVLEIRERASKFSSKVYEEKSSGNDRRDKNGKSSGH